MPTHNRHAAAAAKDIITRAKKATGPMWNRLNPDGQMVEVRAILCCDMLNNMAAEAPMKWWQEVHGALIVATYPPEDQTE